MTPHDGINWEKWESIGTLMLAIVTVLSTGATIWYSQRQIASERKKTEQFQRQQTFEILKEFYEKKKTSLMEAITFLSDKISHFYYSLNANNINYLDKLKEEAIELETLDRKRVGLEIEIKLEKDANALLEKQIQHQTI